jgi:hypothetical protein
MEQINGDRGTSQDMASVVEAYLSILVDSYAFQVIYANTRVQSVIDIIVVEQTWIGSAAGVTEAIAVFVDASSVIEHDIDQVTGCMSAVNGPTEPLANQIGQIATVIHVCVAKENGVDGSRIEWERGTLRAIFPTIVTIDAAI